nr:protein FAR1-RELATED SEQUENCE 5-like [Aegilops tauschii subsp. strangulata]XP_040251263.1 protein FAR1-RELATED SEQUENCE 5-like [Aegilops tauschii subsp. strangulata]
MHLQPANNQIARYVFLPGRRIFSSHSHRPHPAARPLRSPFPRRAGAGDELPGRLRPPPSPRSSTASPPPPLRPSTTASSPATHRASPPKPKYPIATPAPPPPPPPPPEPNASAAFSGSSPAQTTSTAASARPEDHQSPPSGDASTSAAIAAAAASARPEECTPRMDMEFETELQAYDLYRLYAFKLGFNVRRRYTNRSKTSGEVTSCKFACSREGFKDHKPAAAIAGTARLPRAAARLSRAAAAAIPAPDGRTGCNAHLTLRRTKPGGRFQVSGFQPRHNHPLFAAPRGPPSPFQSPPNAAPPPDFIDDDASATARAAWAEGEGPLRTRRQWEIKYGEAAALLNHLQRQSLADPAFHHAVQLDVEDKVANVFWVDAKMVADYAHFGDAVAFDVVSRNSISLRHLASFVGCNSFGEPVVFGLALMYDETCESFRWLFQTFLHAMSGRAPKTFISHQDTVIAEALSLAMPGTTTAHAICAWHIKHVAKGNIRQLSKGDANFIEEFKACVDGEYDEEAGFLAAWDAMVSKYELRDNAWLQRLFEKKHKWARPYAKGIFSAGMEGTRLNERLNSEVRGHLRAEVDIVLFLRHLQKVISDRRHRELEMEYGSRLMMPYLKIRAPVLTQASDVYTSVIFQLFQEEYEEFQSAYIVSRDESSPCREYVVSLVEKEDRRYTVYGNPMEQTVTCSCGKFETVGFLCSHALKILDVMDIKYIPDRYIMKRWTKYARRLTSPEVLGQAVQAEESLEISNRYQHLCPKYVRLVARASECEESSRVLDQFWGELGDKVEQILQKQTSISSAPVTLQPDVQNLKMALSSITDGTESENVVDISSRAAAKTVVKKKGQKSKNHPRNCVEKGLTKKQKVHSEEPAVVQYGLADGSAQSGNAMFQGLEAAPNLSKMGSQTPTYIPYMGTDFLNPMAMGTLNYEEMHRGASLGLTLLPSQDPGFVACHTSQASSDSQAL